MSNKRAFSNPSNDVIRKILASRRNIAVVGCSPDPRRDSNQIAQLLKLKGHQIFPVNPLCHQVLETTCYPCLQDIPEQIHMVNVFRRAHFVSQIAEEAIGIQASVLWLQLGIVDDAAALRAEAAGLCVVMDRCPAIEYKRLF